VPDVKILETRGIRPVSDWMEKIIFPTAALAKSKKAIATTDTFIAIII
jgi:hypothetical protein